MNRLCVVVLCVLSSSVASAGVCTKAYLQQLAGHFSYGGSSSCSGIYGTAYCTEGWDISTEQMDYRIEALDSVLDPAGGPSLTLTLSSWKTHPGVKLTDRKFVFVATDKAVDCADKDGAPSITYRSPATEVTFAKVYKDSDAFAYQKDLHVEHEGTMKKVSMSLGLRSEPFYEPKAIAGLLAKFRSETGEVPPDEMSSFVRAFYANPKAYLEESEQLFKDDSVCAAWTVINDMQSYDADQLIRFARRVYPDHATRPEAFARNVKRQERALHDEKGKSQQLVCKKR
jgi:hypothetical protein